MARASLSLVLLRVAGVAGSVVALVLLTSSAGQAAQTAQAVVPLPSVGNVTVARLVTQAASAKEPNGPRLALSGGGLPAGTLVLGSVTRTSPARFAVTVAVIRASAEASGVQPSGPAGDLTVRLSAGFRLIGRAQIAKDVLYANPTPPFGLVRGGRATELAGRSASNLTSDRIVRDAQLLALDRSVPLADMGLLGLPFVAGQFTRSEQTVRATIVMSWLNPVSAVELRFPAGTTVTRVTGPARTEGEPKGSSALMYASTGSFQEGITYTFAIDLSRAPRTGEFVTLRASPHYFESTLPFTERFALP
jgi:hypothetical protein